MSTPSSATNRTVPPQTLRLQADASHPAASAWVSANAGSGKTTVLVRRVLRLMLTGIDPARILCLTYTTAAAANMANRLFGILAAWVPLDDASLDERLVEVLGQAPSAAERTRARRLFAEALETPGGLKLQTIHAFCTRVLQTAPFEARIPAHFQVISDTDKAASIEAAIARTLGLAGDDAVALKASLDLVASAIDDQRFRGLIDKALGSARFLTDEGGVVRSRRAISDDLAAALEVDPSWTRSQVQGEGLAAIIEALDFADLAAAVLAYGSATEKRRWHALEQAYRLADDGGCIDLWQDVFLTGKNEPRKDVVTKPVLKAVPSLEVRLEAALKAFQAYRLRLNGLVTFEQSLALFTVARLILADYSATKRRMAVLDYTDLIQRTRELFASVDAAWLIYKLDAGLDHLLVDEAQDTSRDQWAILNTLTSEFLSGEGQRDPRLARTIFAVGDEKQSIYGFQGAAPEEFGQQRFDLGRRFRDKGDLFADVRLTVSFRSTRDVIEAVDAVFADPFAFKGLSSDPLETSTVHETVRGNDGGAVDLWDLVEPEEVDQEVVWHRPLDSPDREAPAQRLARTIAGTLKSWLQAGHDDLGQPFSAGDVLILLPKRNAAFAAIVRALKRANVPVAGMDRMRLSEHIAIEDMVALARAALLPDDDLMVAVVLKSPLFGLGDDDLLRLAPQRTGSLRSALAASPVERDSQAHRKLATIEQLAMSSGPFTFFSTILSVMGGRTAMLARLGAEAADAIDAFLVRALDHEQREGPSLLRFLAGIEASSDDVKRDLAIASGEVRVMTVHGAKGLEAKVVFIADIGAEPGSQKISPLIEIPSKGQIGTNGRDTVTVWSPRSADDSMAAASARGMARQKAIEEHHRLLYVAMTRAENRLVVCGVRPKPSRAKTLATSWYGLIEAGLLNTTAGLVPVDGIAGGLLSGLGLRRFKVTPEAVALEPVTVMPEAPPPALPAWVHDALPKEQVPLPPLAPASLLQAADQADRTPDIQNRSGSSGADLAHAAARGRFVHLLLQWLPGVQNDMRRNLAQRLAARHGSFATPGQQADMIDQTIAVMDDVKLAMLFGEGSLAEVEIGGEIRIGGTGRQVSGRIDRLLVRPREVILADFKTGLVPPRDADAISAATLAQVATYRSLLMELYPDRPVRVLVIYTSGPVVIEISHGQLEAALGAVFTPSSTMASIQASIQGSIQGSITEQ